MNVKKNIAIVANSLKRNGSEIARNTTVEITIPGFKRGSFQNTGEDEKPLPLFDGVMEAKVTAVGVDVRLVDMCIPKQAKYKLVGVQEVSGDDGSPDVEKIEYVFTGVGSAPVVPGSTIGEGGDGEYVVILNRFEEYIAGEEVLVIDRDQHIYRVNGVDYFEEIRNMLQ